MTVVPKPGDVFHGEDGSVSVVLPDLCDPDVEPTREEVEEYAAWLGIDVAAEAALLAIAREGLRTPLPAEWRACRTGDGEVYYFNFHTGESSWDHPMDEVFKRRVAEARASAAGRPPQSDDGKGKGSKKSKNTSASASATTTGIGGEAPRRLEKGAAGHVESPKWAGKNVNSTGTLASPSASASSASTTTTTATTTASSSLRKGNALGQPMPTVRLGRLGALGTPEATQRIQPDVSELLAPSTTKTDKGLTRFSLGVGNSNTMNNSSSGNTSGIGSSIINSFTVGGLNSGLGKQTKAVDGAKGLEAHIRQRINDEIDARRRAMRLRHEKELADEREISTAALEKAKLDNERKLTMEEQQQQRETQNTQSELQTVQKSLEREYNETNERVTVLRNKLQHQKVTLENNLNQAIAESKEKLQKNHTESLTKQRETSAATIKKEKEKLTNDYAKDLDVQTKILERKKIISVETFEKELKTAQSKLIEELAAKKKEATINTTTTNNTNNNSSAVTSQSVEEAQKACDEAIQQATSEATTALETLRREYTTRVEKLEASKAEKLRAKDAAMRANNESTSDKTINKKKEQTALVEAEEARLRKALDEKVAKYEEETRQLVAAKEAEFNTVKPIPIDTENSKNSNNRVRLSASAIQEQRRFDVASRQLDTKHEQTMMRIRSEHAKALRDRKLFDPRESPEYSALVQELQKAWLNEHPTPTPSTPQQGAISPTSSMNSEKEVQKQNDLVNNNSNNSGKDGKKPESGTNLGELGSALEKEIKESIEAYRAKRMDEIRAELTKYRETLAEEQQKRLKNLSANINAEAEAKALAKYPLPLLSLSSTTNTTKTTTTTTSTVNTNKNRIPSSSAAAGSKKTKKISKPQVNTVTTEEAEKQEESLRQRLQARIDILQEAVQRAELELRQKLNEAQRRAAASTVQSTIVSSPVITISQRPPPVPTTTTTTTTTTPTTTGIVLSRQEQPSTPRFNQQQQQQSLPLQQQQQQQHPYSFSTPVFNRTLSTIAPVNSLWSSARPSPTHQFSWLDTTNTLPTPHLSDHNDRSTQEGIMNNPTTAVLPQKDAIFEDRLRRAKLLLKEKKEELRIQQTRLKRAREVWLQDMKDCHKRHDRERAVLLRQIKVALEQKAQQLNHEVIDMRSASAWIHDREAQYKQLLKPQQQQQQQQTNPSCSSFYTSPAAVPAISTTAGGGGSGESKQIIELLQSMLARTEMLESYIKSPQQSSALKESSNVRCQSKQRYQNHEKEKEEEEGRRKREYHHRRDPMRHTLSPQPRRPRHNHVDAITLGSDATPGDIRRWLQEQQIGL